MHLLADEPDACSYTEESEACSPTEEPDTCSPTEEPDTCNPTEEPNACSLTRKPDACSLTKRPDACSLTNKSETCSLTKKSDKTCKDRVVKTVNKPLHGGLGQEYTAAVTNQLHEYVAESTTDTAKPADSIPLQESPELVKELVVTGVQCRGHHG